MKRYVRADTNTKIYPYYHLDDDSRDFALSWFIRWMKKEHNVNLSLYEADEMLADSNTAFNEDGLTVDNKGNMVKDRYLLPNNWKDYLTDSGEQADSNNKEAWFNTCLKNKTIYYDEHLGGYIYEYSEMGSTDEIFIGKTKEEAFKEFCNINW